ncbi:MAG: hypothetical protein ACRDZO_06380 [Egibacteraceae bacterium]
MTSRQPSAVVYQLRHAAPGQPIGLASAQGARLMDSTPRATAASIWPSATRRGIHDLAGGRSEPRAPRFPHGHCVLR